MVARRTGEIMERYVAIDNVCAWPNLTLLPDGTILATIFNQPCHLSWEGETECWASEDSGLTWRRRGVPAPHEPGTNRANVGVGLARDGSLIALVAGFEGVPAPSDAARLRSPVVCRSRDAGRTWERTGEISSFDGWTPMCPFGNIIHRGDGSLAVAAYASRADGKGDSVWMCASRDDGHTWKNESLIAHGLNETALLTCAGSRILAVGRTDGDMHLRWVDSADNGRTWSDKGSLTLAGQHPAHLLRLADGAILLTYGIRNPGLTGIAFRVSRDEGENWSEPHLLLEINRDPGPPVEIFPGQPPTWDCGYPGCVQLKDGTIVTAYYARSIPTHTRYHMGVARWRL